MHEAMAPMLDVPACDYAGHVEVRLNANPEIPIVCHVHSAPTLLQFKDGREQATPIGSASKSQAHRVSEVAL